MKYSANSVWENKDEYDVVIVGAGHAGCEAALACARMGFQTLMFTVSVDSIALMPCNPNIGGSSKGQPCQMKSDALGGEMGKGDRTGLLSSLRVLNSSKDRLCTLCVRRRTRQITVKRCERCLRIRRIWKSSRWK